MRKHTDSITPRAGRPVLAALASVACVWLAACGNSHHGATATSETVARVGSRPIKRASVEHWMSVMAITDDNDIPKTRDPKRAVPRPPDYTTCIAAAKTALKKTPRAQIKHKCALLRQALQEQAIDHLISTQQLYGESAERNIVVTDTEATKRLEAFKRERFPSRAAYDEYLGITGQTIDDQLERVKFDLLTTKLLKALTGTAPLNHLTLRQHARLATFATTRIKWINATSCSPDYTVPLCSHYKPPAQRPTPDILIAELGL